MGWTANELMAFAKGVARLVAAPQQETQSALFDKQGFRAWVLHNLPDDTIIGSSAYWADHLSAWAQRFVKKAPQQGALDALEAARKYGAESWDDWLKNKVDAAIEAARAAHQEGANHD